MAEKLTNEEVKAAIKDRVKELHEQAFKIEVEVLEGGYLPVKAHPSDAGFDVFATDDIVLHPGEVIKHPLNFRMKLPTGSFAEMRTKSGLGSKGLLVYAGVIDQNYRGIPHVIMTNVLSPVKVVEEHSHTEISVDGMITDYKKPVLYPNDAPIKIARGRKLAQFIVHPYSDRYYVTQVDKVDTATDRGENGFGSSGSWL